MFFFKKKRRNSGFPSLYLTTIDGSNTNPPYNPDHYLRSRWITAMVVLLLIFTSYLLISPSAPQLFLYSVTTACFCQIWIFCLSVCVRPIGRPSPSWSFSRARVHLNCCYASSPLLVTACLCVCVCPGQMDDVLCKTKWSQ